MNKNAALSLRAPLSSRAPEPPAAPQGRRRPADRTPLRAVLSTARVVPIYWDKHFLRTPSDVIAFNEFLRILFESTFMSALGPHGVRSAELLTAFVPDDEAPTRLTRPRLRSSKTFCATRTSCVKFARSPRLRCRRSGPRSCVLTRVKC